MPNHPAISVANEVLATSFDRGFSVKPMKLQKMLYFCHGWNLEVHNEPLVADSFQAWTYGPVHPSVYGEFRHYGSATIDTLAPMHFDPDPWRANLTPGERRLIGEVVDVYGGLSGSRMVAMTHRPGTPWSDVWRGGIGKNDPIPNERIRREFQQLRQSVTA